MNTRSDPLPFHSSEDDILALKAYLFRSDTILARALADYERNIRRRQALQRRRKGVILTVDELRYDLEDIFISLVNQLDLHARGLNKILKMPVQALIYAKYTALAIKDYPRFFEHDPCIKHLWDALESIYKTASAWCDEHSKDDCESVITSIRKTANDALKATR